MDPIIEVLKSKTTIDPDTGCWLHDGSRNNRGYSHVVFRGKTIGVHRLSAHLYLGMLLDEPKQANHKDNCPNKNCWNPEHIYVGTQQENYNDTIKNKTNHNVSKTHCPQGHEYTSENTKIYDGRRKCIICSREKALKRYHGNRSYLVK